MKETEIIFRVEESDFFLVLASFVVFGLIYAAEQLLPESYTEPVQIIILFLFMLFIMLSSWNGTSEYVRAHFTDDRVELFFRRRTVVLKYSDIKYVDKVLPDFDRHATKKIYTVSIRTKLRYYTFYSPEEEGCLCLPWKSTGLYHFYNCFEGRVECR